jgi:uncharacterized protein YkwD
MLPFTEVARPQSGPSPALDGSPDHELERLLHQAAIALLAAPIRAVIHVGALLRRSTVARFALGMTLAVVFGLGIVGAGRPETTVATPPVPIVPLTQAAFSTKVETDHALTQPVTIEFTAPMDPVSVAAATRVDPTTAVTLAWDATGTALTISPQTQWAAGTFHTVTVEAGALARSGQPLARPARAVFLTRGTTIASIVATKPLGTRVALSTAFAISFARPVDASTVQTAIRLDPPTPGIVRSGRSTDDPNRFTFEPTVPLRPDVTYRLIVQGVRDTDGLALSPVSLVVRTTQVPSIVRFRPRTDTKAVARDADISVRFSQPMDRRSTARAFTVSVAGKQINGTIGWAERDTVLVFNPAKALPFGSKVAMRIAVIATNTAGVPLAAPGQGTFTTVKKGATSTPAKHSGGVSITGGGSGGGGSWASVERYYLGLMNCTRTGGWVTSTGKCSSPGGRNVAPLRLDSGISSKVSRPYAKKLAVNNECSHFIGGNPGDRLRRAGYTSYRWAENIGCRSGSARAAVLGSHLFFQAEKSTNGGHYVNLMNPAYNRVGIGVWVSGGRVRLVVDFYHS